MDDKYDYELDAFKYLENQYLHFYGKYTEPNKYPKKNRKNKKNIQQL
jgi:hypothetical protein